MTEKILIDKSAVEQVLNFMKKELVALTNANMEGVISETIWFSEYETLFDAIAVEIELLNQAIEESSNHD